jgi:hypothetical protein
MGTAGWPVLWPASFMHLLTGSREEFGTRLLPMRSRICCLRQLCCRAERGKPLGEEDSRRVYIRSIKGAPVYTVLLPLTRLLERHSSPRMRVTGRWKY